MYVCICVYVANSRHTYKQIVGYLYAYLHGYHSYIVLQYSVLALLLLLLLLLMLLLLLLLFLLLLLLILECDDISDELRDSDSECNPSLGYLQYSIRITRTDKDKRL